MTKSAFNDLFILEETLEKNSMFEGYIINFMGGGTHKIYYISFKEKKKDS